MRLICNIVIGLLAIVHVFLAMYYVNVTNLSCEEGMGGSVFAGMSGGFCSFFLYFLKNHLKLKPNLVAQFAPESLAQFAPELVAQFGAEYSP